MTRRLDTVTARIDWDRWSIRGGAFVWISPRKAEDVGQTVVMQHTGATQPAVHRRQLIATVTGCVALAVCIVGTFLPWLDSGETSRNSYELGGAAGRLGLLGDGVVSALVGGWPLVGPICLLPVVAVAARWWRTAAAGCAVIGAVLAGLTVLLVGRAGSTVQSIGSWGVALRAVGPDTVTAGGIVAAVAGLCGLALSLSPIRSRRVGLRPVAPIETPSVGSGADGERIRMTSIS